MNFKQTIVEISKSSGIGQRTIQTTLSEYKNHGTFSSPNMTKNRPTILHKINESDKNAIRKKIHDFWRNREIPTITKMLTAINEDQTLPNIKRSSFQRVLKDLQFEYVKKNRNSALLEREDLITCRRRYLDKIRYYREHNRPIYYLDETWVDTTVNSSGEVFLQGLTTGQKEASGKGKFLIVVHIGSTDGFVPGGFLCFESKTNSIDYHNEMNGDKFYEWFVRILPLLKENAVIVMDNASYHSVKKCQIPTMSWIKQNIIDWLESKGEIVTHPVVKNDLLKKVRKVKKQYDKYVIDEYAKDNQKLVLRLPPYHCELNPINLAWDSVKSYVRMHNTTFKLNDVLELIKKGLENITPEMWTNFVGYVIKEEDKFWNIENLTDEILDKEPNEGVRHNIHKGETCDASSSDLDSD